MNGSNNDGNENKRYVANVITQNGQYGPFQKALINNINPANDDGSPNRYYTGNLIWCDSLTGAKYLVKQFKVTEHKDGRTSLVLDLDDTYQVQKLD